MLRLCIVGYVWLYHVVDDLVPNFYMNALGLNIYQSWHLILSCDLKAYDGISCYYFV